MARRIYLIVSAAIVVIICGAIYTYANQLPPFGWLTQLHATSEETDESSYPEGLDVIPLPETVEDEGIKEDDIVEAPEQIPEQTPASTEEGIFTDEYGIKYNAETGERLPAMALTFDDGPNPTVTPLLIEQLNERGVNATFFMLGRSVAAYPEVAALVAESGNQIGSHGWAHESPFTQLSDADLATELADTSQVIYDATGIYPTYVRPPYGTINKTTAAKINAPLMLWTIDTRDWDVRDAETVKQSIVDNAVDGGVVIMHDNYDSTREGVIAAIDELIADGWQFVTLEQYYRMFGITPENGKVYRGKMMADLV